MPRDLQASHKKPVCSRYLLACLITLVVGLALPGGCGKSEDDESAGAQRNGEASKAGKVEALDRSYLPSAHLAELDSLALDAAPPCSLTIDSLRPVLAGLATTRKALDAATDKATAVTLLSDASAALSEQSAALAPGSETDELRRLRAELLATLGDLADGLQKSSNALSAANKPAADETLRRIQNGVQNTRSTIDALVQLCASP
jgi:hypothetical protein